MQTADEIEADKRKRTEIWESVIEGTIFVEATNHLGRSRDLSTKGVGDRIRISEWDREMAEERIRSQENNPFRNGMLIRVDQPAAGGDAFADEDLRSLFSDSDDEEFKALLLEMSEVNVRRMKALAAMPETKASVQQAASIQEVIDERFSIGGTVPSYDELMRSPLN